MLKVCEKFPQLGGIREYLTLPPGEKALYEQYTLAVLQEEAKMPLLRVSK